MFSIGKLQQLPTVAELVKSHFNSTEILLNNFEKMVMLTPPFLSPKCPQRVLIAGGCYAGLAAALNLVDLCDGRTARFVTEAELPPLPIPVEITIVDEKDGYYHIIGSPLALVSKDYASKAWIKFDEIPALQHPSIRFIHGSVSKVDITAKSATIIPHGTRQITFHEYDYFIAATGLRRRWPVVPQSLQLTKYIHEVGRHIDALSNADQGVVIIGGGAVGIEMAAELKAFQPDAEVTLVHSRDRLMSSEPLPDDFKDHTLALLRKEDIKVVTGKRILSQTPAPDGSTTMLTLSDNMTISASVVISAISHSIPTSSYLPSEVLDAEGYVKIAPSLHFKDDYHLSAGDVASWSGIRRCGGAMLMGLRCAQNIHQHMLWQLQTQISPTLSIANGISGSSGYAKTSESMTLKYKELEMFPPMIGIAVGSTAAVYSPTDGTKSGPDMLNYMFGDDLGFSMCYKYLNLGECAVSITGSTAGGNTIPATEDNLVEMVANQKA